MHCGIVDAEGKSLKDEDVLQHLPVGTTATFYFRDLGAQISWVTVIHTHTLTPYTFPHTHTLMKQMWITFSGDSATFLYSKYDQESPTFTGRHYLMRDGLPCHHWLVQSKHCDSFWCELYLFTTSCIGRFVGSLFRRLGSRFTRVQIRNHTTNIKILTSHTHTSLITLLMLHNWESVRIRWRYIEGVY